MKETGVVLLAMAVVPGLLGLMGQDKTPKDSLRETNGNVSFQKQVFPIIEKYCLPCHAEESYNPSELSLDSYELLLKGGKHGSPVEPGKPEESILIKKLGSDPPFGDPMPLNVRRRKKPVEKKKLTEEELQLITTWVAQGAKDN
jgi:uncharacterized membrane protein